MGNCCTGSASKDQDHSMGNKKTLKKKPRDEDEAATFIQQKYRQKKENENKNVTYKGDIMGFANE